MDSGHVWTLGKENAASSKHASAEPYPAHGSADVQNPTSHPIHPAVCHLLSLREMHPPASATPQGLSRSHLAGTPRGLSSPALLVAQHGTMGRATEHRASAGQALHHVGLKCPTGCAAESSEYHQGSLPRAVPALGCPEDIPWLRHPPGASTTKEDLKKGGGMEVKHVAHDPDTLW